MPDSTHQSKLSALSAEHKALIEKNLKTYQQLEHGMVDLDTDDKKHFQAVARGLEEPRTRHAKAYRAYKLAGEEPLITPEDGGTDQAPSTASPEDKQKAQGILESLKKTLNEELLEIEQRQDISEDEKAAMLINRFAVVCAAVAIQPLPFADILILTPIQIWMAERIASVRGMSVSEAKAQDILIEVGKVVGLGMVAQQIAIGLYKTILPGLGGFMSIPLVYGLTYGIGNVLDYNYTQLRKGKKASPEKLKEIFNAAKKKGEQEGKKHKAEVKQVSNDLK